MQVIHSDQAPQVVGPYSQAIEYNGVLYTAGQIGLDPVTNTLVDGIEDQALRVLRNLDAVLIAGGTDRTRVLKTTIFLSDMANYDVVNRVYAGFFGEHKPARSTVQVAALPREALVEIECVAALA